jgi:MurNAc alpha-1-phosphate uridylyltransferase
MRAMILAAGRGERMGELTLHTPKPLLQVGKYRLIEYAIYRLKQAKICDIIINVSYLGEQIQSALGDGSQYGVQIRYSLEKDRLETGGGILQALPLLGDEPFIVLSSDVICDYPLASLPKEPSGLAHLVLVANPEFHPAGDFGLNGQYINRQAQPSYTFGNIGVYRKELFVSAVPGRFPLNQLLFPAIDHQQVTGEVYRGQWYNVGSQAELHRAREDSNLRPLASETNTLSN